MTDWQLVCKGLWGPDWIAPLAEVLGVNRRTVERWKSGTVEIPGDVVAELARLPRLGSATRAYGEVLRRLARGETVEDLEQDLADRRRALSHYKNERGKFRIITVVAGRTAREKD
jgi:hypothetical protein